MPVQNRFLSWLLASETPSLRYLTLLHLCDRPPDDAEVVAALRTIMHEGPVPAILEEQAANGAWAGDHSYYTPKYVSTHWSLTLLVELAVDGADDRFQKGVSYMLDATDKSLQERVADGRMGFSCFWGNLMRYAVHAGRHDDVRLQRIVAYAVRDMQDHARCEHNYDVACAWGVIRTLWGLAALPAPTPAVDHAVAHSLTFLLDSFSLLDVDYPRPEQCNVHTLWHRLNFPLFYQTDVLFALRVLDDLGALDRPGAQPALTWLAERRQKNGRWRGSSPFRQRTWRALGGREETDRWVSLQSAHLLQRAGRRSFAPEQFET